MSIEALAQAAGMTVRNVRNYQTKGLLPPPKLEGRKGFYLEEHLARLQLIREMQLSGFNLAAIKALLDRVPEGAGSEALRLERSLLSPWIEEESEVVSASDLAERFGTPDPDLLERAERAGILRVLQDGNVELTSPTLVRAGEQVMELGVPLEEVVEVTEEMVAASDRVAAVFTELFLKNIWRPFVDEGRPAERWPEIRAALERLRPIASDALLATFKVRMAQAVEEAFGTELDRHSEGREVG